MSFPDGVFRRLSIFLRSFLSRETLTVFVLIIARYLRVLILLNLIRLLVIGMDKLIPLGSIEPNSWNPNVMPEETFKALLLDMKQHGFDGIQPISVRWIGKGRYEIVNGEHRWRAAKKLRWRKINCTVLSVDEAEAKAINYRQNAERGTIDPVKAAELFQSEVEAGLTKAQVARKYGIHDSTVAHRLDILKVEPKIRKRMVKRGATPSHLEAMGSLPVEGQKKVVKDLYQWGATPSIGMTERLASNWKREKKEAEAFSRAIEKAKHKVCPTCKKDPRRWTWRGKPWAMCKGPGRHVWNVKTGKTEKELEVKAKAKRVKVGIARTQRTETPLEEFNKLLTRLARSLPSYSAVRTDDLDITFGDHRTHVMMRKRGVYGWLSFSVEAKMYKDGNKAKIHLDTFEKPTKKDWKAVKKFLANLKKRKR